MTKRLLHLFSLLATVAAALYTLYSAAELFSAVALPGEGESAILYSNQARSDLTRSYLAAIDSAREKIVLVIYNLSDPTITAALRRRAEEGIDVTVVCDGKASRRAKSYLGTKVKVYRRNEKGLMHIKALVVDESLLLIGSANLSSQSLRMHGNLLIALRDREVARFVTAHAEAIASGKSAEVPNSKQFTVGGQPLEIWFLPDKKEAEERLIALIDGAKKTIKVAMFTWTRRDFAEAILRSRLRGVKVEPLIDRNAASSSSKKIATLLFKEKLPLKVNSGIGLLHHKLLLIDETTLVSGSANWTKAAFRENHDCFIILEELKSDQKQLLDTMWHAIVNDAAPYTP